MQRWFFLLLVMTGAQLLHQQNINAQTLRPSDSALVKSYRDTAWRYPLYDRSRQAYLDKALQLAPQYAYLWQQKAMPLFKQFKYELGMPYLDSAVKYDPDSWLDYRAFMKCIFQKSYRSALEDFYAVIARKGNGGLMDHPYAFYMGLCYLQLDNLDSAERLFRHCIEDRIRMHGEKWVHQLHWFYLGIVLYERNDFSNAYHAFLQSAKAAYGRFADAKYYASICAEKTGNTEEAKALIAAALEDHRDGRSFNEDNSFYELYPYQVMRYRIEGRLEALAKK